ncbi:MAG: hypothetical protein ABWY00_09070 [Dongiaceae bacterium]
MNRTHLFAGAVALAITLAGSVTAYAAAMPYRFERVNDALHVGPKDIVQVRLVHGMENMTAPVKAVSAKDGICSFAIQAAVPGRWQLHLGAGVQGEPAPVRGTIDLDLVQ